MSNQQEKDILKRYLAGTCTLQERAWVEDFYLEQMKQPENFSSVDSAAKTEILQNIMRSKTDNKVIAIKTAKKSALSYVKWGAAIVFFLAGSLYYLYFANHAKRKSFVSDIQKEITPGKNKATLTLSNGKSIVLSSDNGEIVNRDNGFHYEDGTQLGVGENLTSFEYSLNTPKGGQYNIVLPDGTRVWLNSASTLHYPATFDSLRRIVYLDGEGYFEVKKQKGRQQSIPFIVKTKRQEIKVLGTSFNVEAYSDIAGDVTTLVEGSVALNYPGSNGSGIKLKPNQQAREQNGQFRIHEVNVSDFIAWKNGALAFNEDRLDQIMQRIGRWYDADIQFDNEEIKKLHFSGQVSKHETIQEVLKKLELTGKVRFEIKGKKIIANNL